MPTDTKLTLRYFGIAGAAEPIRLAAAVGKIPFVNKAVPFSEWKDMKPTTPLGRLPLLDIESKDGTVVIPESVAILRYFGKLSGLYPEDAVEALQVDSVIDVVAEASKSLSLTLQGPVSNLIGEEAWSKEEIMKIRERIMTNKDHGFPFYLTYFNNLLEKNGSGWFVGDKMTIADLRVQQLTGWISSGMLDGIPKDVLDVYPLLKAHVEKVEDVAEIKEFRSKYPKPYGDFNFLMDEPN